MRILLEFHEFHHNTHVCSDFHDQSLIIHCHRSSLRNIFCFFCILFRIKHILKATELEFQRIVLNALGADSSGPTYACMPWADVVIACVEYQLIQLLPSQVSVMNRVIKLCDCDERILSIQFTHFWYSVLSWETRFSLRLDFVSRKYSFAYDL